MTWDVDPVMLAFGTTKVRWYGVLFSLGIVSGYGIIQEMFRNEKRSMAAVDTGFVMVVAGTVIGARLGHCLFYEPEVYLSDPLRILKIWEGGLASHGGFIGVMVALALFARKHKEYTFLELCDRAAGPSIVVGAFIRIGNFFNSEIVGKPTDGPFGIVFSRLDDVPRHPSQLYESAGYFTIAAILYGVYRLAGRRPKPGRLLGVAMILGFGFRMFIETFKENQVPFEASWSLNMGQLLSIPFILVGAVLASGIWRGARAGAA